MKLNVQKQEKPCDMLTFLHLSDLHFSIQSGVNPETGGNFDRDREIRERLLEDLGSGGRTNFDAILVTGDITFSGIREEFEIANTWFNELRQKTGVPVECLYVVPGNHDVNRKHVGEGSVLWSAHKILREQADAELRTKDLKRKLEDTSWSMLLPQTEYNAFAEKHGCLTSPGQLAWSNRFPKSLEDGTPVRIHGLNTALVSNLHDARPNLLMSPFQFGRLSSRSDSIELVLCHHPSTWLLDGDSVEDRFRTHAHVVLTGHEHRCRCFTIEGGVRIYAGAVHPSRGESDWQPGYNVIRLSIDTQSGRELLVEVETRVWHPTGFEFVSHRHPGDLAVYSHRRRLPVGTIAPASNTFYNPVLDPVVPLSSDIVLEVIPNDGEEVFAANRRKLIIHFFQLSFVERYNAAVQALVWEGEDDGFEGQELWARIFARAEANGKLGALWDAVASRNNIFSAQPNPF